MFGLGGRGKKPPIQILVAIPSTCAYCPKQSHVRVIWPGEEQPEFVCEDHARVVHEGLMEIELLTRVEA